jgi:hypothetical protein
VVEFQFVFSFPFVAGTKLFSGNKGIFKFFVSKFFVWFFRFVILNEVKNLHNARFFEPPEKSWLG